MVKELNDEVKCGIRPSKVHGCGVFAIVDIKAGEKMYCQEFERAWYQLSQDEFAELKPEIRMLILQRQPGAEDGITFLHPNTDAYLTSFMNHSDDYNYDARHDCANRDIKAGEEIFENYGAYEKFY
mgnify:CR=1 FL=1